MPVPVAATMVRFARYCEKLNALVPDEVDFGVGMRPVAWSKLAIIDPRSELLLAEADDVDVLLAAAAISGFAALLTLAINDSKLSRGLVPLELDWLELLLVDELFSPSRSAAIVATISPMPLAWLIEASANELAIAC